MKVFPSRYGTLTARDAHDWFLDMLRVHEEFEVETSSDATAAEIPVKKATAPRPQKARIRPDDEWTTNTGV